MSKKGNKKGNKKKQLGAIQRKLFHLKMPKNLIKYKLKCSGRTLKNTSNHGRHDVNSGQQTLIYQYFKCFVITQNARKVTKR